MFNSFVDDVYTFEVAEPRKHKRHLERMPTTQADGATASISSSPSLKRARAEDAQRPRLQGKKDKIFEHFNKLNSRLEDSTKDEEAYSQLRNVLDRLQRVQTKKKFYKHLVRKVLPAIKAFETLVDSMPRSKKKKKILKSLHKLMREAHVKEKYMEAYRRSQEQGEEKSTDLQEELANVEEEEPANVEEEEPANVEEEEPANVEEEEQANIEEEVPANIVEEVPASVEEQEEESTTAIEEEQKEDTQTSRSASAPLRWNQWYTVTLSDIAKSLPKKEQNKVIKMLKKGPQRLKLVGIGVGTLTFEENLQVQTSHVHLEPYIMETTDELQPGMLIEIKYEGYDWDLYQYISIPSGPTVIPAGRLRSDLADEEFYSFDETDDEWRFPEYPSLNVDDIVDVFFAWDERARIPDEAKASGWERVRIMEAVDTDDNTHIFHAEFEPHKNSVLYDNQVIIDVWKRQVRDAEQVSVSDSEVDILSEEEDDVDSIYEEGETITFQGVRYKIKTVVDNESGVSYMCVPVKGGQEQEITEDDILSAWDNEFALHEWVIHNHKTKLVSEILWSEKKYRVVAIPNDETDQDDEEDEGEVVDENDIQPYEPLEYNVSRRVIYNWEVCEILTVDVSNREYVLQGEGGETYRVTDEDLVPWCLQVKFKKGKAIPGVKYVCWRREEPIVRIERRGPRGKEVPTEVLYIPLMSKSESLKEKPKMSEMTERDFVKHVIAQVDVNAYFDHMEDESEGEDNGNQIEVFVPGDKVEIYDGWRTGTIVRHILGDIPDDDTFVVLVDGEEETVGVGEFGRVEDVDDEEDEQWAIGDHVLDEGTMWVVDDITIDGNILWAIVDKEAGKIITDYRNLDYECDGESWHLVGDPESETDSEQSEEEESEEEAFFKDQEYVTIKGREGVFQVQSYSEGKYVLEDADGSMVLDISEDSLETFESEFEEGEVVFLLPGYEKRTIEMDNGDGTYLLDNGDTVEENELETFTEPLTGLVRVQDFAEIFEVISFEKGQYTLRHGAATILVDMDAVTPYEGPEFAKGDIVQLENGDLREVDSFDTNSLLYKLKKGGRQRYSESQLFQAPPPKFGRFNEKKNKYDPMKDEFVRVIGEEGSHVIKKIDRLNRTYTLDDGRVISEDKLEELVVEEDVEE